MYTPYNTALPEEAREVWKDAEHRDLFCYSLTLPWKRSDLNSFLPIPPAPKQARQALDPGSSARVVLLPARLFGSTFRRQDRCLADVQPCSLQPTIIHHRDYARREGGGEIQEKNLIDKYFI